MGLILDQVETIEQGPTVTLVDAPRSLQTFTDVRNLGMTEITMNDKLMIR